MNETTLQTVIDVITRAQERLERKIARTARRACKTALLQLAPQDLILPTPAVGLMAFRAEHFLTLPGGSTLRSLESLLPDGEARLSIVAPEAAIHPWQVHAAHWLTRENSASADEGAARVIGWRAELRLGSGGKAQAGWLALHVAGGELLRHALDRAHVSWEGVSLPAAVWSPGAALRHDPEIAPPAVIAALSSLGRNIVQVHLPPRAAKVDAIEIVCRFADPIPAGLAETDCQVTANVHPVWNSLPARYPARAAVEQAVSGSIHRLVHPLLPADPGEQWYAWRLLRVAGSGGRPIAHHRRSRERDGAELGTYRLAMVAEARSEMLEDPFVGGKLTPAIALDERAYEELRAADQQLVATYLVTQGALANNLPDGAEFQLMPGLAPRTAGSVRANLLGMTWNGTDGYLRDDSGEHDLDHLFAMARGDQEVRVGDVAELVRRQLGHVVELVDTRDLLAWSSSPLTIRYRFRHPDLDVAEEAAVQDALHALLSRLLHSRIPQGFELHAITPEVDHEPAH